MTDDYQTLRLFGIPIFTLVVGSVFVGALVAMAFGVRQWKRPAGKIAVIASTLVLLLFALAALLVLLAVASGSMG